ncbi:PLD nuclease N-terminal domain-containing protein [Pseudomonas sp. P2757]|uniref:PLD nuclease N-terminal domain-containing protein n=1 Tax=unclassified Pseudomonas TaxID=196821 RepID=UPI003B5B004F
MQIETIWVVLAVALLLVELWAINRVRKSAGKSSNKGVWIVLIVFVPLLGLIAWALAGPKHVTQA